jgi:hypothetical protein
MAGKKVDTADILFKDESQKGKKVPETEQIRKNIRSSFYPLALAWIS